MFYTNSKLFIFSQAVPITCHMWPCYVDCLPVWISLKNVRSKLCNVNALLFNLFVGSTHNVSHVALLCGLPTWRTSLKNEKCLSTTPPNANVLFWLFLSCFTWLSVTCAFIWLIIFLNSGDLGELFACYAVVVFFFRPWRIVCLLCCRRLLFQKFSVIYC